MSILSMRIAIDISQIVYEGTGVAGYTSNLIRNLLLIDRENEYLLFGISLRKRHLLEKYFADVKHLNSRISCKFLSLPQTVGNLLWNRFHFIALETFVGQIDLFHSSDWIQPPTRAKKITTVHDLVVFKYPQTSHPYIVETQKRRLYWVKKECDKILADSFATKNDLAKILHLDPTKIEVVYPGVAAEYRPIDEEEKIRVRQKYGLGDSYILAVGTMEPRKNLNRVMTTFERFLQHSLIGVREKPIELVVVGKFGWGDRPKKGKYVRFLGFIEKKDLQALYASAALFFYPSLYEGFGLPVLEAMACGTPVVTSDRGSLKEIVGDSALLVDPEIEEDMAVQMTKVFVDSNLRLELIKRGKENAARFNWETTARQVKEIYEKVTC